MKYDIIILDCKSCGSTLETDLPLEQALKHQCGRCNATDWKKKNAGKAIARDAGAPVEILAQEAARKEETDA